MARKDLSNDVLNMVNQKTGKKVTAKHINNIASGVNASTVSSEAQLRKLIKQVSNMVNIEVPESTVKEIVQAVKKSGMNPNNMEEMMKMMMGKK